jgi:RHS repeat-associated protein
VNNYTPITINYAPNGNITQKSDVGAYVYDATKVNAVKEVNSNKLDMLAQQNITYSSFQSPTLITEGDYQLELLYSHDRSRKKTTLKQNNQTKQTTYFSGGYEKQVDAQNNTTELHYLNNINTIVVKQNNQYQYYFTYKDHLGTIVAITDINGNVVEEFNYDAWGLKRNPDNWTYELDTTPSTLTWFKRGYTGHEHLDEFGLINMNSRLYDPQIGRMLSPDNYIQSAGSSQSYNRYSYVWNNPMKFTDPSGDLVFVPILAGMAYGALIGAGISSAVYTSTTLITGQEWSWNSFGKSMAFGALGGALGGGLGSIGAQLGIGQNIAYNVLSNVTSQYATTLAFGGDITAGGFAGMVAGGFIGAGFGNFSGVKGGALKNAGAELGFGILKGATTGGFGGAIGAAIDGRDIFQGFYQGAKYGAISGGTMASMNLLAFGAAYKPDSEYGDFGRGGPVYRRGHFLYPKETGISIGRNLVTRQTGYEKYDHYLRAHETGHYYQQSKLGFANFYSRTLREYNKYGMGNTYETGGTLEFGAEVYALQTVGYFKSSYYRTYIYQSDYDEYYPGVPQTRY